MRGLRAWVGFRQCELTYDRPPRAAGDTKYRLGKLLALAGDGLLSFTLIPLRVATCLGVLLILASRGWGLFVLA